MKKTLLDFSFSSSKKQKILAAEESEEEVELVEDDGLEAEGMFGWMHQCQFRQVEKVPNFMVGEVLSCFYSSGDLLL